MQPLDTKAILKAHKEIHAQYMKAYEAVVAVKTLPADLKEQITTILDNAYNDAKKSVV